MSYRRCWTEGFCHESTNFSGSTRG